MNFSKIMKPYHQYILHVSKFLQYCFVLHKIFLVPFCGYINTSVRKTTQQPSLTVLLPTSRAGTSIHLYTRFFPLDSEQIDRCKWICLHFASKKENVSETEHTKKTFSKTLNPYRSQSFTKYFL